MAAVTQRRRLSRAQVAAGAGREVRPGISARTWWGAVPVRSDVPGGPRAERVRLQAMERTGRVLVEWLIGRWRDQVSGK